MITSSMCYIYQVKKHMQNVFMFSSLLELYIDFRKWCLWGKSYLDKSPWRGRVYLCQCGISYVVAQLVGNPEVSTETKVTCEYTTSHFRIQKATDFLMWNNCFNRNWKVPTNVSKTLQYIKVMNIRHPLSNCFMRTGEITGIVQGCERAPVNSAACRNNRLDLFWIDAQFVLI